MIMAFDVLLPFLELLLRKTTKLFNDPHQRKFEESELLFHVGWCLVSSTLLVYMLLIVIQNYFEIKKVKI